MKCYCRLTSLMTLTGRDAVELAYTLPNSQSCRSKRTLGNSTVAQTFSDSFRPARKETFMLPSNRIAFPGRKSTCRRNNKKGGVFAKGRLNYHPDLRGEVQNSQSRTIQTQRLLPIVGTELGQFRLTCDMYHQNQTVLTLLVR